MKKINFCLALLICFSSLIYSQQYSFGLSAGTTNSDYGQSISKDTLGNIYTTGIFQGTVDFDQVYIPLD